MAHIPMPDEFRDKIKPQSRLGRRKTFLREFERMTEKQQAVMRILMKEPQKLTTPKALCVEAGYQINDNSRASAIMKAIEGKLGTSLCQIFGITEYDLLKVLVDAINAEDVKPIVVKKYDQDTGKVISERIEMVTTPNHRIRLTSAQTIIKLGGYEPLKTIDPTEIAQKVATETLKALRERQATQERQLETNFEVLDVAQEVN